MTVAIHGFLGLPSDWDSLPVNPINLWEHDPLPFKQWAATFNAKYSGTLVGYSLGARLALHALIENPTNWTKAIIISGHPGLCLSLRPSRLVEDGIWAQKFASEPWDSVLQSWNGRDSFKYDKPIQREEKNYSRLKLAKALTTWSLGNQEKLHDEIAELPMPIDWIVGEKDARFLAEAQTLTFKNPNSRLIIIPNAGHRISFESVAKISF